MWVGQGLTCGSLVNPALLGHPACSRGPARCSCRAHQLRAFLVAPRQPHRRVRRQHSWDNSEFRWSSDILCGHQLQSLFKPTHTQHTLSVHDQQRFALAVTALHLLRSSHLTAEGNLS
ncbi:hypothetical protein AVEN_39907-1 [Araneus ventricosus]|uniref:Uncharacterized protein n=1 Tax=Araneus ventricosus TaxID=182803 RepID=A0A4Y2URJ8_ARAVE|nr:hypothetical protein AVEN_39907-1 [Araneus ventricosus]